MCLTCAPVISTRVAMVKELLSDRGKQHSLYTDRLPLRLADPTPTQRKNSCWVTQLGDNNKERAVTVCASEGRQCRDGNKTTESCLSPSRRDVQAERANSENASLQKLGAPQLWMADVADLPGFSLREPHEACTPANTQTRMKQPLKPAPVKPSSRKQVIIT